MNSIFQKGYGRYEITFEHDKSGIDFFYKETGSDILNNVVMASGQEKAVLAMANRLALCSLQNLGILVVDEIDSNASDENSLKLYETILGEKGFNQIWVITHCTPTKEYLENLNNTSVYEIEMGEIKK
jgi:chromosome segregation ATPase